jgi:hypothetical protein
MSEMTEAGWSGSFDKLAESLVFDFSMNATTLNMPSDREILIMRAFDAPRRLVFEAISKPEHIACWWGPRSMKMVSCEMDFRPGGAWRFVSRGPDLNSPEQTNKADSKCVYGTVARVVYSRMFPDWTMSKKGVIKQIAPHRTRIC